jgi:hypothetical protein
MKDYKDLNSSFMNWYLTKIIYRIFCGDGNHRAQFDEQLRLIHAEDDLHAFQKARAVGHHEQDNFLNNLKKPVHWKFIDVSEIYKLDDLVDGAEMYSSIHEEDDADIYIGVTKMRAKHILENSISKSIN